MDFVHDILVAVFLGLFQGLTEFLPVSSSGHLVLAEYVVGLKDNPMFFNVMLHVATLVAVVAFYWRDVLALSGRKVVGAHTSPATIIPLIIGSIPTACIGLAMHKYGGRFMHSVGVVGACLIATGMMLWSSRQVATQYGDKAVTPRQAFLIGIVQGIAVLPGISRSGSTIVAGMWLGLERQTAARFSFLLSLPAIGGAALLEWDGDAFALDRSALPFVIGMLVALVSGFFALSWLVQLLRHGGFWRFALYCWAMGALALAVAVHNPVRGRGQAVIARLAGPSMGIEAAVGQNGDAPGVVEGER